jgi:hypothetical protein
MKQAQTPAPHERVSRLCGARAKSRPGGTCRKPAGWGTDHVGEGRCRIHGGVSGTLKHGRYSKVKHTALRELIERHEQDPEPLNIHPELAAARALFESYIDRYQAWADALLAWHESWKLGEDKGKPTQLPDIADAYRILSEVTKIAERIEKVRSANAISRPELLRVLSEMSRTVDRRIDESTLPDDEKKVLRGKISGDWAAIRLA